MYKNMEIFFDYSLSEKIMNVAFNKNYSNDDFKAEIIIETNGNVSKLKVVIAPTVELKIEKLYISMDYTFKDTDRIYVNGYQSWTDSREFCTNETLKTISKFAAPIMRKYQFHKYGDYTFKKYSRKKGEFHGYTYSYIRDGEIFKLIGSLSERSGYTIIEEYVGENEIIINKECEELSISEEYVPFELVWVEGTEKEVFDTYFDLMNIKKPKCKPISGWTSWYNYYQNINQDIIFENVNNFKAMKKNIDIFQIDDGYQTAVGDWLSVDKNKFPKGMKYIAKHIKDKEYKAGIWLAPFVCETNSEIFHEKKEWILKDNDGELVVAGSNWSGFYALDFYNPKVQEYIKNVFSVILNEWGYDMVKLDFLYAVCLLPRKDKTRGQIMTEAMEFLRECVGDKLILGCGVPLGPAFGMVDYCRIGCDVGLDWNDKFHMRFLHRERVSTLNALRNVIGRRHLNGRAFLNDPDVFFLREDNISLTEIQKETVATINHMFGGLIFTSDNIQNYDTRKNLIFDRMMNVSNKGIEKVECLKNGIVEILYNEENKKYLALVNFKNMKLNYNNNFGKLVEVFFDKENSINVSEYNKLEIEPYRSKVFAIKDYV